MKLYSIIYFCIYFCFMMTPLFAGAPGAYDKYQWRDIRDPLHNVKVSAIDAEEKIRLFDSIVRIGDTVFSIVYRGKVTNILVFDLKSAETKRIPWPNGAINGWTTDNAGNLIVLSNSSILTVEPKEFTVKEKRPMPEKQSGWFDLVLHEEVLYMQNFDKISAYRFDSLKKIWNFDATGKQMQRMVIGEGKKLYISSTFWGAVIREFDLTRRDWGQTLSVATHHHNLMRTSGLQGNLLAVYDFSTGQVFSLMLYDGKFISLQNQPQMLENGNALRHSPQTSRLNAMVKVTAQKNTSETAINVLLPHRTTYAQELSEERFIAGAQELADEFGNRILRVKVPALKAGQVWNQEVWSGKLTRYMVSFRLHAPYAVGKQKNPGGMDSYLNDSPYYVLKDKIVQSKKNELMAKTTAEFIQNVYLYAVKMPYVSGKFEPAPKVIAKYNGACTEHSYAQIALLRAAGIPARLVWNYLPSTGATQYVFNHKFAEAWVEGLGWIPLEPLASPRLLAGTTHARHVVWAVLETPFHPSIHGGDRLVSVSDKKDASNLTLDVQFKVLTINTRNAEKKVEEETQNLFQPVIQELNGETRVH